MRISIAISLIFTFVSASAQEKSKSYYNDWGGLTTQDSADYFTEWVGVDSAAQRIANYIQGGNKKFVENYKKGLKQGQSNYYHKNGQLKCLINYYNDYPLGVVKSFYPDGSVQSEELYDTTKTIIGKDETQLNFKLINYYDSAGNWLTKNGNGVAHYYDQGKIGLRKAKGNIINGLRDSVWVSHFANGTIHYKERWENGVLIEGISNWLDGREYSYKALGQMAQPVNGMQAFYNYVGQAMKYPTKARRLGVEGRVFLEFIVNRDGSISNVVVIRGIGTGCDEEAVRVVRESARWKPGLQRGRPVRSKFRLAIIFKLR